jgi:hypothetical protein
VPLAGVPLRWRHMLGWDPDGPGARHASEVFGYAVEAYLDILAQRPRYAAWLDGHPDLGVQKAVPYLPGREDPLVT